MKYRLRGVTATFTPSEGASKFDFALGLPSDEADFLAGNFLGTQTVLSNDPNFSAKTQSWTSDIEPDTLLCSVCSCIRCCR